VLKAFSITPRRPSGAMDRAFSACDNHAVPSFGRDYFNRNRAELGGIIKLAGGSKHLKSLYAQR
jgi:hypothetical protein